MEQREWCERLGWNIVLIIVESVLIADFTFNGWHYFALACAVLLGVSSASLVLKLVAMRLRVSLKPRAKICCICDDPIGASWVGAGNGKHAHIECFYPERHT